MSRLQYPGLPRAISVRHVASLLRVLALFGLFLLPIQTRAGTEYLHPHALLHLLIDVADNEIDHHAGAPDHATGDHSDHPPRSEASKPDLPTLDSIQVAAGGLAVTPVTLVLLILESARERVWPHRETWRDRRVRPDFPPPRLSAA